MTTVPKRRVLVSGATGFIGRALTQRLLGGGFEVMAWTRDPRRARNQLGPDVELVPIEDGDAALREAVGRCDAVVSLAGASVIAQRWTRKHKGVLWASRVELTDRLVRAMAAARAVPAVLVSASAVGYYGDRADEPLDEQSGRGEGFMAALCDAWESAAQAAEQRGVRVVRLRIGIVLGLGGGALQAMLPAFRLGLGGPIGSGLQVMPWIALHDLLAIIERAIEDRAMSGAFNATAPRPVDARTFARTLGAVVGRPALIPVPALALKLVLGERAKVVLQSQRAVPAALSRLGHVFEHPQLDGALRAILAPSEAIAFRRPRGGEARIAGRRAQYVLESQAVLDVPLQRAFDFFCRAENLGFITPGFMRFEIVGEPPTPLHEGARIEYRIGVGFIPLRWTTIIQRWSPPAGFVDQQMKGPYALWWHEHILQADGARTRMIDRVRYALPLGPLGRLVHVLM